MRPWRRLSSDRTSNERAGRIDQGAWRRKLEKSAKKSSPNGSRERATSEKQIEALNLKLGNLTKEKEDLTGLALPWFTPEAFRKSKSEGQRQDSPLPNAQKQLADAEACRAKHSKKRSTNYQQEHDALRSRTA